MRLHEQRDVLLARLDGYREGLEDLQRYLHGSKFNVDTTVQVSDILMRLQEIDNNDFLAETYK